MIRRIYMTLARAFLSLLLLASLGACAGGANQRVTIQLKNDLHHPIQVRASAGLLSKTILLQPGQTEGYWFYSALVPGSIVVTVLHQEAQK